MQRVFNRINKYILGVALVLTGVFANIPPIYASEMVTTDNYDDFASEIAKTEKFKATVIVKATDSIDLSEYPAKRIIQGPDGYYFLEFEDEGSINSYAESIKSKDNVEYANKNYNVINKATVKKDGGKNVKKTLKASVQALIEEEKEAEKNVDENQVKEWKESSGADVEFKSFEEFYKETNGKSFLGGQCAAGVQYYMKWLGYSVIRCCDACTNGAKCFWIHRETNGILENFEEIGKDEELQNGDILVYGPSVYNSPYGHTGIYHNGNCYGQNQNKSKSFTELSLSATPNYLGALRPKVYSNGSNKYNVSVNLAKNSNSKD